MNCQHAKCGVNVPRGEGIALKAAGYNVKFCSWRHAIEWQLAIWAGIASPTLRGRIFRAIAELGKGVVGE